VYGISLSFILAAVLLGPVLIKPIGDNIELFFLGAGTLAAAVSGQWNHQLVHSALTEPIPLTAAVAVFGAVAKLGRPFLDRGVLRLVRLVAPRWIYFTLIVVLGLLSSVITAVIAALILVEAIALLKLDRTSEIAAVVLACFSIGLGAALTPIGEPLGTIAIAALRADFWYLVRLLGPLIVIGILIISGISLFLPARFGESLHADRHQDSWTDIGIRAGKVFLFVAGLVGLSFGMRPLVDEYIQHLPQWALFWVNTVSAVVDNATLTAAEIGPSLTVGQQRAVMMGLLISGGMLIPGNIPNIVAAGRLEISSAEWAKYGLVIGFPLMALCFIAVCLIH